MAQLPQRNKEAGRIVHWLEKSGNRMLHPATMFFCLSILVVLLSAIANISGFSAIHPVTKEEIFAQNLLTPEYIRRIFTETVSNFSNYAPFGMAMTMTIGIGITERSGLAETVIRKTLSGVRPVYVTFTIALIGVVSSAAGDAGNIVLPPLAAIVFLSMGRHPFIGIFLAYACVNGGFCASLFPSLSDVLCYGFTAEAAATVDPVYAKTLNPLMNYYFSIVSVFGISIIATIVTEKIIAPRFEKVDLSEMQSKNCSEIKVTMEETRAMKHAGIALAATAVGLILLCVGPGKILADPETGSLLSGNAPFLNGITIILSLLFFIPSLVYAISVKTIKNDKDLAAMLVGALQDMGPFILVCFFAAQFAAFFSWSNLGTILSIKGASLIQSLHIKGLGLLLCILLLTCTVNLLMASATAKWALLAPILFL